MDHVLAQGAFIGRADPLEGGLGLLIPVMGLELNPDAAERLESVGEHQKLGLGIHRRSLIARGQPGAADFYPFVLRVDGHIAG